jgi:hypothetical protein
MLASFHARDLRTGDRISLQTAPGDFHQGGVLTDPVTDGIFNVSFQLQCTQLHGEEQSRTHGLSLPRFRLVTAERSP